MSSQITSGQEKIDFEHLGIGTVLQRNRLVVPINQRNYAWEDKQVKDLFRDFSKAISEGKRSYFLGTIVLTTGDQSPSPEVTDGQQRLSTSTMLLAAIRDYLVTRSDDDLVNYIETEFLYKFDPDAREIKPRLTLNADDHEFFRARVLERPGKADRVRAERQAARDELRRDSHKKIARAAELATSHVQNIIAQHSERNRAPELMAWVKYIEHVFQVILLKVPDELNAFVMFETLNDRGLRTTQLDLVKNYLFRQVGNERAKEAHWKWSSMIGVLESTGVDDIAITYLRHLVNSLYGLTREREVYEKIQTSVAGRGPAMSFLENLAEAANDYVALFTHAHAKWNTFPATTRQAIQTMNTLRVIQVRSLMLSIVRRFSPAETDKAFRMLVNWTVRFLIVGGGRSGAIEEVYAQRAHEISTGTIASAKQLAEKTLDVVPSDKQFEEEFAKARVSQNYLARYYLRSLEMHEKGLPNPEFIPNEEAEIINLEHVLPENPEGKWGRISPETASAIYRRIGNLVLLSARINAMIGNEDYNTKKPYLLKSSYLLTKEAGKHADWGEKEINERQQRMAKIAAKTWPLRVR